jgi:molybdate transport system substrate-binding protein
MSGGFAGVYKQVLPHFERTTGISVTTGSGASQGSGPNTIGAMVRAGASADVVILSKEGLAELIKEGRILSGTAVDLAQTPVGVAVRAGAPKPDISTVERFTRTLLNAKSIAMPGSTSGIYLTTKVFPRLGISDKIVVSITSRGSESTSMVAAGRAAIAIQPVSELVHVAGIDFVGTIPQDVQFMSIFSAAVMAGSTHVQDAKRLIAFLASGTTSAAMTNNGMEPPNTQR